MDRRRRRHRLLPLALVLVAGGAAAVAQSSAPAAATSTPPLFSFAWGDDFRGGSTYEANRDTVVRSLASGAATSGRGFFNYSSGDPPNRINGAAMCYADSQWADCQQCLDTALSYVFTERTYSSNVAIMYAQRVLRYSTEDFLTKETEWGHVSTVFSTSIVDDVGSWNETRWTMMTQLVDVAAAASPLRRLATGNTTYKDGTTVLYGLMQCRNDMSAEACRTCLNWQLQYLWGNFPRGVINSYVSVRGFSCFITEDVNPIVLMVSSRDPSPSSPPPAKPSSSKSHKMALIIGLATAASVILFLFILSTAWFVYYRMHKRIVVGADQESNEMEGEFRSIGKVAGPTRFAYDVLAAATPNFWDNQKLGEGGFGSVYRGFLGEMNLCVAIKRVSSSSRQRRKEYASEVKIISRLRHRNLVKLIGWCHSRDELLLVYELMTNTSLDVHLYGAENVLPWRRRYEIILGIGSALLYLHQDCEQGVLHRDIKPSNVMLDAYFNAKLGDFGLARLVDHGGRGAHTTELAGTMGYMDPACISTGRFSTQSDMYSFGVLLLEVACGRQPVVVRQGKTIHLARRVLELYGRDAVLDAADRRLNGDFDARQMECVLVVGLWCTQHDPALRPSIRQAISVLRLEASLPTTIATTTEGPPDGRAGSAPSTFVLDEDRVTSRMNLRSTC